MPGVPQTINNHFWHPTKQHQRELKLRGLQAEILPCFWPPSKRVSQSTWHPSRLRDGLVAVAIRHVVLACPSRTFSRRSSFSISPYQAWIAQSNPVRSVCVARCSPFQTVHRVFVSSGGQSSPRRAGGGIPDPLCRESSSSNALGARVAHLLSPTGWGDSEDDVL